MASTTLLTMMARAVAELTEIWTVTTLVLMSYLEDST